MQGSCKQAERRCILSLARAAAWSHLTYLTSSWTQSICQHYIWVEILGAELSSVRYRGITALCRHSCTLTSS